MSTQPFDGNAPVFGALGRLYQQVYGTAQSLISHNLLSLFARLAIAGVFWRSFLNKVETNGLFDYVETINNFDVERSLLKVPAFPIEIRDRVFTNFAEGGSNHIPFLPGDFAAVMATMGEGILPILLVLGLFTRFAATGLIVMALVIQIFVFPTNAHFWGSIALWFVPLFYLVGRGSGALSLDYILSRQFAR